MPSTEYEAAKHRALAMRAKAGSNLGKKYKSHRERGPNITVKRLLKAIKGSGGVKSKIAKKLSVGRWAVTDALHREGFEVCLEAYQNEVESIIDLAEKTVTYCMKQREHLPTAASTARWYLEKKTKARERGFQNVQTIVHEGGENPLKVLTAGIVQLDLATLPLDVRKAIMKTIDEGETELVVAAEKGAETPENATLPRKRITIRKRKTP